MQSSLGRNSHLSLPNPEDCVHFAPLLSLHPSFALGSPFVAPPKATRPDEAVEVVH